jgi:phosphoglycerol transferase MdoB-like AlkP superfamily enzyme
MGRLNRSLTRPTSEKDERAIARATALFSFLLLLKVCLLLWNVLVKRKHPLADVPVDGMFFLIGADLLFCLGVAGVSLLVDSLCGIEGRWGRISGRVAWGLIYFFIVMFSIASFQVARIYGDPLDIELLRSADDLMVMRQSIWAYIGPMPFALTVYGLVGAPLLALVILRSLRQRRWLQTRWQMWAVVSVLCMGAAIVQKTRLHRIDTFGVKDNAVLFFIKEYKPAFKPIDAPELMHEVADRQGEMLQRQHVPRSLWLENQKLKRDFASPFHNPQLRNVVVVQMESTGALHVNRETAPNICALADHGLSLGRHSTVATQTARATCGLYYSDYLPELGTTPDLLYGRPMPQPALAEVLKFSGYGTGVFHTGFLDYLGIRFLFGGKGVDRIVGAREMMQEGAALAYSAGVHEERTVEELTGWIRAHREVPFFATYITEFPHHPYVSMAKSNPFPDDSWQNRYHNSLHYADESVGRLVKFLADEKLLEPTLIVVVGDHGETVSGYPVGHGLRMSVEEMRTPCIFSNPVLFRSAVESRLSTSHLDVAPTILGFLGMRAPDEWLGRNLLEDEVPAVLQFVSITHMRSTGVIDNGLLYSLERMTGQAHLFEIGDTELRELPADDPLQRFSLQYKREIDWYTDWSLWRHLNRATKLPDADIARHKEVAPVPTKTMDDNAATLVPRS